MNDPDKPQVQSIHRILRQALLTNDQTVPVTNWFGPDGEDCDPMKAISCVCGTEKDGWWTVDLRNFSPAKVH